MSRLVKWIIGLQFLLTVSLSAQELSLRVLEEFLNDPSLQGADVSMAFLDVLFFNICTTGFCGDKVGNVLYGLVNGRVEPLHFCKLKKKFFAARLG